MKTMTVLPGARALLLAIATCVAACGGDGGGADAGLRDATLADAETADARAADAAPTQGAIRTTWTIDNGLGAPLTCAQVPGEAGVSVLLTPLGTTSAIDDIFTCEAGVGETVDLVPGDYAVSVALVNGADLALATAPTQTVTVGLTDCDAIAAGDCATALGVTLTLLD